jgi:hypothetical protein
MEIGTGRKMEREICVASSILCVFKFSSFTTIITELLVEVNLGYQFDWLLEIVIFLVAVDKVQYKDAHGRRNLCNYYTDQCM